MKKMRGSVLFPAACIQVLQKCGSHTVFTCSGNFQINAQRKFPRFSTILSIRGFKRLLSKRHGPVERYAMDSGSPPERSEALPHKICRNAD